MNHHKSGRDSNFNITWGLAYLVLAAIILFVLFFTSLIREPKTVTVTRDSTIEDRVFTYIKKQNSKLNDSVAMELSTAIVYESNKHQIPVNLILGLIKTESHFKQYAMSGVGAMGFWQILPKHHIDKIKKQDNQNMYDPVPNSSVGAQILKTCLKRHKTLDAGLGCYNGTAHDPMKKYANKVLRAVPLSI